MMSPIVSSAVRRRLGILIGAALLYLAVSLTGYPGEYGRLLVAAIAFNAISTLSISTLAGTTGIWSLGHTAFIALGGYLAANLAAMGVPLEVILPAAALASALLGYVLGLSAGRFSILYFGLLTLAVALTSMEVIGRLTGVTGGDQGMPMGPLQSWIARRPLASRDALGVALALAAIIFVLVDIIVKGPRGRRWRAVKSHRMASMTLGLVPHHENALAFALSAGVASCAGVAGALAIGYLEPESFNLDAGVMLIAATVIGGIGSFWGAVVGAGFIVIVPDLSRGLRDVSAFALGFGMVVVLLFLPRGIVPGLVDAFSRRRRAPSAGTGAGAPLERATDAEERVAELSRELMPPAHEALEVQDLEVRFGGLRALHGISFRLEPGKTLGIIGPNGAGKTTLLNVLSGYVQPSSCAFARLGGANLRTTPVWRRLRLGFGRSFQHAELFGELTIREMLLLAATVGRRHAPAGQMNARSPAEIAQLVLEGLDLEAVADRFPDELPFGIQKVADIGRILAAGASVVALDEPFSGLDQHETRELRAILRGMQAAGVSILIIDHAVQEVLDLADSVLVLDFGEMLAFGPPAEIRAAVRVQEAYFGRTSAAVGAVAHDSTPSLPSAAAEVLAAEDGVPVPVPAIDVRGVTHRYGGVLALHELTMRIERGSFSAILGSNGAGKSTLAMILAGLLDPTAGDVQYGSLARPVKTRAGRGLVRAGICLVPEGRRLFADLSLEENLVLGAYGAGLRPREIRQKLHEVIKILPAGLRDDMRGRTAGMLSGGERQMLALARALMADPAVLLIDEPSMGLAPILTDKLYGALRDLHRRGVTVVVIEQQATHAIRYAQTAHILDRGRLVHSGPAADEAAQAALRGGHGGATP